MAIQRLSQSAAASLILAAVAAAAPAATYDWLPALGSGSWNDAANWQIFPTTPATQPPGAADVARFTTTGGTTPTTSHTVTVPTAVSVLGMLINRTGLTLDVPAGSSLAVTGTTGLAPTSLTLTSGVLNVGGTVTANTFIFNNGQVTGGAVTLPSTAGLNGALRLGGSSTLAGNFLFRGNGDVASTSSGAANMVAGIGLTARASAALPTTELKLQTASSYGTVNNAGTITLDADAVANNSAVTVSVANTTTGSYGSLYNTGTVNFNAGGSGYNTRSVNGAVQNFNGTINVAGGAVATVSQYLDNNGTVNVAAGGVLALPTFTQSSSSAVVNAVGTLSAADIYITGGTASGTFELAGTDYNGTRRLTLGSYSSSIGTPTFKFVGGGELAAGGGSASVASGITLLANASVAVPQPELKLLTGSSYGTVNNAGVITLGSDPGVLGSLVTLSAANTTTGSYGSIYNTGTINLNAGSTNANIRNVNGAVQNFNGTINVAAGVAANFSQYLDNNGTVNIASGATLTVPTFTQSSSTAVTTITGTLNAADFYFTGGAVHGTVTLAGTDYNGTRRLTLGGYGASLGTAAFVFDSGGEVAASGGSATVPGGISLSTRATVAHAAPELKLLTGSSYGTVSNAGTITLDADAAATNSTVTLSAANTTTGSYGSIYNTGTINLDAGGSGTNTRTINAAIQNFNGTINVATGATASVSQYLDNNGTLSIAAGATLNVPTFSQSSSTAVTTITGTLNAADLYFTGGQINGTGTLTGTDYNGTRRLTLGGYGASLGTAAFVFQGGGEVAGNGGSATVPSGITITSRATTATPSAELKLLTGSSYGTVNNAGFLSITSDSGVANSVSTLSVANTVAGSYGSLYNTGTLELKAGNSSGNNTRNVNGSIQNFNGTVTVGNYVTANVSQTFDNNGTLTVAALASLTVPTFNQSSSTAVTNAAGAFNVADVYFTGGAINGTVNLTGTDYNGTRRLTLGGYGGSLGTAAFVFQNGGEVAGSGGGATVPSGITVTSRATAAAPSSTLKLLTGSSYGTVNNAGVVNLTADAAAANSALTLSVANTTVGSYGSLYNTGTINLNAGGSGSNTRTFNGTLQNFNGTLNVAAGVTAAFSQSIDNNGTLNVAGGAALAVPTFTQSGSTAVATLGGKLTAAVVNFTGGVINGNVDLAGTDYNGTRRLLLSLGNTPHGTAAFTFQGGGEASGYGGTAVPAGITLVGRATAATPTAELKLQTGSSYGMVINSGVVTLDADAAANNSLVTLSAANTTAGSYGTIQNAGTINLNAGGSGTNTRVVKGTLMNQTPGTVVVNAPSTFGRVDNYGVLTLNALTTFNELLTNQPGGTLNINTTPVLNAGINNQGTLNAGTPPGEPATETVNVTYAIGGTGSFAQNGGGTTVLSGANTYTGTTVVSNDAGTLRATPAAYQNILTNPGGLDVRAGTFVFDTGTAGRVTNGIVETGTTDAALLAQIKALLTAGAPGHFTTGQIRSSGLTGDRTLGYGDNGSGVTVRVTLPGDADLDGKVDFNDFIALQTHYLLSGTRFDEGNFDYDDVTDFNDFIAIQTHYGMSVTGTNVAFTAEQVGVMNAFFAANTDSVPEPAGTAALAIAATGLLRRRRH